VKTVIMHNHNKKLVRKQFFSLFIKLCFWETENFN